MSAGLGARATAVGGLPPRGAFPELDARYCGAIGYEFMHCATAAERDFFAAAAERPPFAAAPSEERNAASLMLRGAELEAFLSRRYPGLKQYGGAGTEALLPCVEAIVRAAGAGGTSKLVIGQAHRGRLALLVALMNYPARKLFWKLDGNDDIPASEPGLDDVSSHIYHSAALSGVRVSLLPNPSHLEGVNPVVAGRVRAARDAGESALALLIHGDGAFSGQGVVAECFAASKTPGFDIHGTVHVICNNLLAFTAGAGVGRSSTYASDAAKAVDAPVLHVNAEDVGAVLTASALAVRYRGEFAKDVVVDLIGYRRAGHNEVDEPAFTSPRLYAEIRARKPFAAAFGERVLGAEGAAAVVARAAAHLDKELAAARAAAGAPAGAPFTEAGGATGAGSGAPASDDGTHVVADGTAFGGAWRSVRPARADGEVAACPDTGAPLERLRAAGAASVAHPPPPFLVHDRLLRSHVAPRLAALAAPPGDPKIDWATGEALAFGLALEEGRAVRLSGQDVERGTFSHRHAVFVDAETEARAHAFPQAKGRFRVHSSLLSEEGVLGFVRLSGRSRFPRAAPITPFPTTPIPSRNTATRSRTPATSRCGRHSLATLQTPPRWLSTTLSPRASQSGCAPRAS
jgi:probable 2-oxoglutarate dehydrogenase E1 component DHKTD1